MFNVVNIIPNALSGETSQDSEPNIAVNPANANEIAISAFTPDPMGGANAPIFVSIDGGTSWVLNSIVPSQAGSASGTGDITPRFGSSGNRFYAGILRRPGNLRLNVLRAANFSAPNTMTILVDRNQVDQPFTQAMTVPSGPDAGDDRVYIGLNDFAVAGPNRRTATVETSLDAGAANAGFTSIRIETRSTGNANQDGPQVRPVIHPDGTVYAVFYGWRAADPSLNITSDVVIVRDDNWASGNSPFTALADPSDNAAGRLIATGVQFRFNGTLAQERLGGDLSITVNPNNSSEVYVAFCDVQSGVYTLHVRRSTDRGVTWSADLRTIGSAKNPALAINAGGMVGLAYQCVTGTGNTQRWETHLETTTNAFTASNDSVLATVPANAPAPLFLPYMGDYMHMMAVGSTFYGVFSTNNTPDPANFPQGVTFLRNHDFTTRRLLALDGTTEVRVSIDPFFFSFTPVRPITRFTRITELTRLTRITRLTQLTRLTELTRLTRLTELTRLTQLTRFTEFTRLTQLTRFTEFTRLTELTRLTRITGLTRFTPLTSLTRLTRLTPPLTRFEPPVRPPVEPPQVRPFIRFGNTIFAPEDLALSRFEPLEDAVAELEAAGITTLDQVVTAEPQVLSALLQYSHEDAARLIELAQSLMRTMRH